MTCIWPLVACPVLERFGSEFNERTRRSTRTSRFCCVIALWKTPSYLVNSVAPRLDPRLVIGPIVVAKKKNNLERLSGLFSVILSTRQVYTIHGYRVAGRREERIPRSLIRICLVQSRRLIRGSGGCESQKFTYSPEILQLFLTH